MDVYLFDINGTLINKFKSCVELERCMGWARGTASRALLKKKVLYKMFVVSHSPVFKLPTNFKFFIPVSTLDELPTNGRKSERNDTINTT